VSDAWGDPDPSRAWRPGAGDPPAPSPPPYYPLPGEQLGPWVPPPAAPLSERLRAATRESRVAAATAAYVALLGAPTAFLWRAFAPTVEIAHTASGPQPVAAESSQLFGVDGSFVLLTLAVGLVTGALAWLVLRRRGQTGPAGPFGLAAGGLLAALAASGVGRKMIVDRYLYDFCHARGARCFVYSGTLRLQSFAAVVVWPAAMLAAFAILTLFFTRDNQNEDV
jgi:hypothetical protein